MKHIAAAALAVLLAACASVSETGGSEIYGEIKAGVETVRTSR